MANEFIFLDAKARPVTFQDVTAEKLTCKFILVGNAGGTAFVFGSVEHHEYHADLVDHYCRLKSIACQWTRRPDRVDILEKDHSIRGGGWLKALRGEKTMRLYGRSTAYGEFDGSLVEQLLRESEAFGGFQWKIG